MKLTPQQIQQVLDGNTDGIPDSHIKRTYEQVIGVQGERIPTLCAVTGMELVSGCTGTKLDNVHYVRIRPHKVLSEERRKALLQAIAPAKKTKTTKVIENNEGGE